MESNFKIWKSNIIFRISPTVNAILPLFKMSVFYSLNVPLSMNIWLPHVNSQRNSNMGNWSPPRFITFPSTSYYIPHSMSFGKNNYAFNNHIQLDFSRFTSAAQSGLSCNNIHTSQRTLKPPCSTFTVFPEHSNGIKLNNQNFILNKENVHNTNCYKPFTTVNTDNPFNTDSVSNGICKQQHYKNYTRQPSAPFRMNRTSLPPSPQRVSNSCSELRNWHRSRTTREHYIDEKELDELVSKIAEEAGRGSFKITWVEDQKRKTKDPNATDDKSEKEAATIASSKQIGDGPPHRSRKQARPCKSAKKNDPSFKGVAITMQIKVDGQKSELVIHSSFSSKLKSKSVFSKPRNGKDGTQCMNTTTHFLREKFCISCKRKRMLLWHKMENGFLLCNMCGSRYKRHQICCSKCWYVPEKKGKPCTKCQQCDASLQKSKKRGSSQVPS